MDNTKANERKKIVNSTNSNHKWVMNVPVDEDGDKDNGNKDADNDASNSTARKRLAARVGAGLWDGRSARLQGVGGLQAE